MGGIKEVLKIILAVLGLVSAYPDVEYTDLFIYQSAKDREVINVQFRAYNMITPPIRDIIDSGIDVNLIYEIKTEDGKHLIYQGVSSRRVSYHNGLYSINGKGSFNLGVLTNVISVNEMAVLTNADVYSNTLLKTEINLLITCDATPEIVSLWGKHPPITITYTP